MNAHVEPKHVLPTDMQTANEYSLSRKHIDKYLAQAIKENPETEAKVQDGVRRLNLWLGKSYYESKNKRLAQLKHLDIEALVRSLFTGIAYYQTPELFVSATSQLAGRLCFDDKSDSILTVAEMVAILCETDAFDIFKPDRMASLSIVSNIELPQKLRDAIYRSMYMPPMVCEPKPVKNNFTGPHLTFNECLILGQGNAHAEDICLDIINMQNTIPLKLDLEFLSKVEEVPNKPITNMEQAKLWSQFKEDSYFVYDLLRSQGNKFWLTNKVDKRGRLYSQGYHVTSQGTSFKKAMIELYDEEVVTGAP
jgi:hypothetical protein